VLVLCHLFVGALLGLAIYKWKGDVLAVPVAAVAAILPDLVDKPLGHIFLQATLDNGRIFGHSLLFMGALVGLTAALTWRQHRVLALALLAGIASHFVLDAMWALPTTLFWPLLGPFTPGHYPDYFGNSIVAELTSLSEYAFLLGLVLIGASLYRDRLGPRLRTLADFIVRHRRAVYAVLIAFGIVQLVLAALAFLDDPIEGQNKLIAAVALLAGGAALRSLELNISSPYDSSIRDEEWV